MAITGQTWFSSWFDNLYYSILYKDRGYEVGQFIHEKPGFVLTKSTGQPYFSF